MTRREYRRLRAAHRRRRELAAVPDRGARARALLASAAFYAVLTAAAVAGALVIGWAAP